MCFTVNGPQKPPHRTVFNQLFIALVAFVPPAGTVTSVSMMLFVIQPQTTYLAYLFSLVAH